VTAEPAVPPFADLPTLGDTGESHCWDVFGPGDELGCLNFLSPATVVAGAREAAAGQVVNLNLPAGEPQPQFWATRPPLERRAVTRRNVRDEYLDRYYLQGSTQVDGFRHLRFRQFGYYGGRQEDDLDERGELGVGRWAERGLIGRGVLVDVARHRAAAGTPVAADERLAIGADLIEETLAAQGTAVRPGDMLLLRTGWLGWYCGLPAPERTDLATAWDADRSLARLPGVSPDRATAAWLWDHRIALLAVDNPTAETLPYRPAEGWAHHRLLVLLGLPLGELWWLDGLSAACADLGRWSFLLTVAPLNLPRGVASPANAYAVL
jgi:hypothetical protein